MIATNFSNVRNNFKEVCDRVIHDSDIAIITRTVSYTHLTLPTSVFV